VLAHGSGKTTTLHSILKFLNTPDTKIWTADPSKSPKGLRQVQINKSGNRLCVGHARVSADRPDIMVGESRDKETVSMGVEASLTGTWSFQRCTPIPRRSITRLLDMGMDPFNFADALLGVTGAAAGQSFATAKQSCAAEVKGVHQGNTRTNCRLKPGDAGRPDSPTAAG
jgi:type II secretory ATPase GspE/PulE/Tfp pilus assembly ATPase PilB-like protein